MMITLLLILLLLPAERTVHLSVPTSAEPLMPWTGDPLNVEVTFIDGQKHYATFCFLDDVGGRQQRIDVYRMDTGELVDTRIVSDFQRGKCAVYFMGGQVRFSFIKLAGPNAIVSGVLFQSTRPCARGRCKKN